MKEEFSRKAEYICSPHLVGLVKAMSVSEHNDFANGRRRMHLDYRTETWFTLKRTIRDFLHVVLQL